MENILDFDLFLKEKEHRTLMVRILGEEYSIPATIPAIVPLKMARAERLRDMGLRNAEYTRLIFEAADAMFGEKQVDRFADRISAQELALLIQKCFEWINGSPEAQEGELLTDEQSRSSLPGNASKK
ncbi:MAG: hypothetical protein IJT77_08605 [Clostridia bacterium]|nr:hypothetical protein [Clostridia bacterium]